jgi:hypothetical protein
MLTGGSVRGPARHYAGSYKGCCHTPRVWQTCAPLVITKSAAVLEMLYTGCEIRQLGLELNAFWKTELTMEMLQKRNKPGKVTLFDEGGGGHKNNWNLNVGRELEVVALCAARCRESTQYSSSLPRGVSLGWVLLLLWLFFSTCLLGALAIFMMADNKEQRVCSL